MNIMVEEGTLPEQVDKVMVDFGYPIGPFATADLSGLDTGYHIRQRRDAENPYFCPLDSPNVVGKRGFAHLPEIASVKTSYICYTPH
jgi:3-hydroxyacyl-CoA dehydrogenase